MADAHEVEKKEAKLPTYCPQNHASNLLLLKNGDILCVWFSGTQEGMADISIYLSRLKPGETEWPLPVKLSEDPAKSEQNPVLFMAPDGKLWLMWTSQKAEARIRQRSGTGFQKIMVIRGVLSGYYLISPGHSSPAGRNLG